MSNLFIFVALWSLNLCNDSEKYDSEKYRSVSKAIFVDGARIDSDQ